MARACPVPPACPLDAHPRDLRAAEAAAHRHPGRQQPRFTSGARLPGLEAALAPRWPLPSGPDSFAFAGKGLRRREPAGADCAGLSTDLPCTPRRDQPGCTGALAPSQLLPAYKCNAKASGPARIDAVTRHLPRPARDRRAGAAGEPAAAGTAKPCSERPGGEALPFPPAPPCRAAPALRQPLSCGCFL